MTTPPKKAKKDLNVEHYDILGKPLALDSVVAMPYGNSLKLCVITKINPKMVRVMPLIHSSRPSNGYLVYPSDCITVDSEDAVMYKLKNLK